MAKLTNKITRFMKDESGPTAVEYAVMLALIIGTAIGAVALVGGNTAEMWSGNSDSIDSAFNR